MAQLFGLSEEQVDRICPLFPKERGLHGVQPQQGGCPPPDRSHQGGMTSKLHGVCHSKGGPRWLHLCEEQRSDFTGADGVLKDLPPAAAVMGDQGTDAPQLLTDAPSQRLAGNHLVPTSSQVTRAMEKPTPDGLRLCSGVLISHGIQNVTGWPLQVGPAFRDGRS